MRSIRIATNMDQTDHGTIRTIRTFLLGSKKVYSSTPVFSKVYYYYCNLSCTTTERVIIFRFILHTVYLAWPNKKILFTVVSPKKLTGKKHCTHTTHNTTHKNKMSCCLPTPNGFALYLHGNICHGPKSWCHGFPRVCCRRLVVGLLSPRLVPLVGMPNWHA